nr:MAG TPA: hypothetical protein [Caudoviricetes sp.]
MRADRIGVRSGLPEKKEELQPEKYEFGSLGRAFVAGFNACLDEILK